MPILIPFKFKGVFNSKEEFDIYRKYKSTYSIQKSQLKKCTICDISDHKMRLQYGSCNNKDCNKIEPCLRRFKLLICMNVKKNVQKHMFFTYGKHQGKVFRINHRGISDKVKDIIKKLLEKYDFKPKRIYSRLYQEYRKDVDSMPSLKQVQHFMKNRQRRMMAIKNEAV